MLSAHMLSAIICSNIWQRVILMSVIIAQKDLLSQLDSVYNWGLFSNIQKH